MNDILVMQTSRFDSQRLQGHFKREHIGWIRCCQEYALIHAEQTCISFMHEANNGKVMGKTDIGDFFLVTFDYKKSLSRSPAESIVD